MVAENEAGRFEKRITDYELLSVNETPCENGRSGVNETPCKN